MIAVGGTYMEGTNMKKFMCLMSILRAIVDLATLYMSLMALF